MVSFLFMPYMARALSYFDYGTYGQTILIVNLASVFLAFGLAKIIFIYLNNTSFNIKSILFTNLISAITLGVIGSLLLYFSSNLIADWFNNMSLIRFLHIFGFSLILSIPNLSINSFLIFKNKVNYSISIIIISNILKVTLVVISIQYFQSLEFVFYSILFSELFRFIIGMWVIRKDLKFNIEFILIKNQLKFGFPLALTGILGLVIMYTDGLMVSKFLGVKEYAVYRNGAIEVPFVATLYATIAAIIMPEVSKLWNSNNFIEIKRLKSLVINYTAVLIYPVMIFFLFNAGDFIKLYLGLKYLDSTAIFIVFNLTLLFRINDFEDILISSGRTNFILFCYIFAVFLNIVLNFLLISIYGNIGAAISTIISVFVLIIIMYYKSMKLINAGFTELINFRLIIKVLLISLFYASMLKLILNIQANDNSLVFIILSILYFALIYSSIIWLGLIPKQLIKKLLPTKFNFLVK